MNYSIYATCIITFFCIIAYYRRMSLFSPLVINCICWYVTFIPGVFFSDGYYPIKDNIFIYWLIWLFILNIIFLWLHPSSKLIKLSISKKREIKIPYQYGVFFLCGILLYRTWIVGTTGSEHFLLNLRLGAIGLDGFQQLGIITRFYPLIFVLFTFEIVFNKKNNKIKMISLWCWMILYAIATMGKYSVLIPVLTWIVSKGLSGDLDLRKLIKVAIITITLMFIMQILRSGDSSSGNTNILKILSVYTYSPFVALGYINFDTHFGFGVHVFRLIYAVGHYLGLSLAPINLISGYVEVPILTNTYTVLYPFVSDFGFIGVIVFAVVYGLFFGGLYRFGAYKSPFYIILYVIFISYIFTQFFGEGVFSVLSANIQMILCLLFLFFISRRVELND